MVLSEENKNWVHGSFTHYKLVWEGVEIEAKSNDRNIRFMRGHIHRLYVSHEISFDKS